MRVIDSNCADLSLLSTLTGNFYDLVRRLPFHVRRYYYCNLAITACNLQRVVNSEHVIFICDAVELCRISLIRSVVYIVSL